MDIDENWEDVKIYYIKFTTDTDDSFVRTLVVDANWSLAKIKEYTRKTIPRIKQIHNIDEIESGWLPRKVTSDYELLVMS